MSDLNRELLLQIKANFDAIIDLTVLVHGMANDHGIDIPQRPLEFRDSLWVALSDVDLLSSEMKRRQGSLHNSDTAQSPDATGRTSESHPG